MSTGREVETPSCRLPPSMAESPHFPLVATLGPFHRDDLETAALTALQPPEGPEGRQFKLEELVASDALLLGRAAYQGFAQAWPSVTDEAGFADKMNSMRKYVVSTTLTDTEAIWNNTTVIRGDIPTEVAKPTAYRPTFSRSGLEVRVSRRPGNRPMNKICTWAVSRRSTCRPGPVTSEPWPDY